MMKVVVIGAGAAGLCCARHISKYPEHFHVQVLEQNNEVGGTWIYSSSRNAQHSSMYKNLKTNLPKEVMLFPDFPFSSHLPSFISHYDVLDYLKSYATHYELNQFIRFGTMVEQVKPVPCGAPTEGSRGFKDSVKWRVTSVSLESGQSSEEDFDAVFVCIGHFFKPQYPDIPGLSSFSGKVIHSHDYREPEVFGGERVLVVGAGQSGRDIIIDLSMFCKNVYLCNRGPPLQTPFPDNVEVLPAITSVVGDKIYFSNGEERSASSIILATGYLYSFPFLTEDVGVSIQDGKRVYPLYKHTINPVHPSMGFIGINFGFVPFPFFDYQVRWVLSTWTGNKSLPSSEDMIKDDDKWFQERLQQGVPQHKAGHYLGDEQWKLFDELAKLGGNTPIAPVIEMIYRETAHKRNTSLMNYRKNNYRVLDCDKWMQIK